MKKLLVVAAFAALATYPAAACEWNREASTQDTVVATATEQTPQAAPACTGADCATQNPASTTTEQTAPKPGFEPAPVVLVNDRR
jgi:hypothetical protein